MNDSASNIISGYGEHFSLQTFVMITSILITRSFQSYRSMHHGVIVIYVRKDKT